MQLGNGIYYSTCSLKAQHVSSGMSLIIRSSNCICSLWFTYVCGDRPKSSLSGYQAASFGYLYWVILRCTDPWILKKTRIYPYIIAFAYGIAEDKRLPVINIVVNWVWLLNSWWLFSKPLYICVHITYSQAFKHSTFGPQSALGSWVVLRPNTISFPHDINQFVSL